MHHKFSNPIILLFLSMVLVFSSCSTFAPAPTPTKTLQPTATRTLVPTATLTPTQTRRPTRTPIIAETQRVEGYQAELKSYVDQGYLDTTDGDFHEFDNFTDEWAQLGWYRWWDLGPNTANFVMSAHFKWTSAYRSADVSGCGFAFAIQKDGSHYAVFLDRSKIIFFDYDTSYGTYSRYVGKTRGSGTVKFGNPFDAPVEADFTLIVNDMNAYVLVDKEFIGQYTLAQSRILRGGIGLTVYSGTNKDFGTQCDMSNIHLWTPN
jgi:hypothetical protein